MATKALKQPDMFLWTGTDKRGVKVKGQTRGNTPALIKADLRKQGIRPLTVKKQNALFKKSAKRKITPKDLSVFFRQLATMMSAGVPLVQSFEIIGRGHENAGMFVEFPQVFGDGVIDDDFFISCGCVHEPGSAMFIFNDDTDV